MPSLHERIVESEMLLRNTAKLLHDLYIGTGQREKAKVIQNWWLTLYSVALLEKSLKEPTP
jgi:hypothetical protein